jgi:hypothetical protein
MSNSFLLEKLTGDAPSPFTPDEFDEVLKKLPRDPQDMDLSKKSRARPAPAQLDSSKYARQ